MQSEFNEQPPKTSLDKDTLNNHLSNQYGFDQPDQHPSHQLRAGEERATSRRSVSTVSSSTSSSRGSDDSLGTASRGLRRSSPVDRIAEHEKKWSRSSKHKSKSQGPGFTVIQRGRSSDVDQVVLTDFPNGLILPATEP